MNKIDREILNQIQTDDSIEDYTVEELREQLETECTKDDPDYDLIDELSAAIAENDGISDNAIDVHTEITAIKKRAAIRHKRIIPKWVSAVCAACVLLICINTASLLAWDMNIFSAVVEYAKSGSLIDLNSNKNEVTADNTYNIRTERSEYDIDPQIGDYTVNTSLSCSDDFCYASTECYGAGITFLQAKVITYDNGKPVTRFNTIYEPGFVSVTVPIDSSVSMEKSVHTAQVGDLSESYEMTAD